MSIPIEHQIKGLLQDQLKSVESHTAKGFQTILLKLENPPTSSSSSGEIATVAKR